MKVHIAGPHGPPVSISACIAALISVALLPCTALAQRGDMNCDGTLNAADVPLFVEALVNPGTFSGCDLNRADMNADSVIDGLDIQPFVAALMAPPCPAGRTRCGAVCVDLNWDSNNCGGCGIVCPPQFGCSAGSCEGI